MPNKGKKYSELIEIICPCCHIEKILIDRTANVKVYGRCSILIKQFYVIDCQIPKAYKSGIIPRNL